MNSIEIINQGDNPLVSIIVITYNSSKFVLETLESAKAQTYQNIELIVSDDCSTDNTVEICRQWLKENKERFVRTELITVEKNSGIPANCNRGVRASKGEWVKMIAGDDIFTTNSITLFIDFYKKNKDAHLISSISQPFIETSKKKKYTNPVIGDKYFYHERTSAKQQYTILLFQCVIHAPNVLIKSELIKLIGKFDERYKLMEDYPYWLKVTQAGFKFYNLKKTTVYYRIHSNSVYNNKQQNKIFNDFYLSKRDFEKEYIYPNISWLAKLFYEVEFYRKELFNILGLNKDYYFLKILYYSTQILSPINIYKQIIKKISYFKIRRDNA